MSLQKVVVVVLRGFVLLALLEGVLAFSLDLFSLALSPTPLLQHPYSFSVCLCYKLGWAKEKTFFLLLSQRKVFCLFFSSPSFCSLKMNFAKGRRKYGVSLERSYTRERELFH